MLLLLTNLVLGQICIIAHQILDQTERANIWKGSVAEYLVPLVYLYVSAKANSHQSAVLKVD